MTEITKTIKCVHCDSVLTVNELVSDTIVCACGKISTMAGIVTEGSMGVDWVDNSPKLLNE